MRSDGVRLRQHLRRQRVGPIERVLLQEVEKPHSAPGDRGQLANERSPARAKRVELSRGQWASEVECNEAVPPQLRA